MTIKKVTVEDLRKIHGGAATKGRGKVKRGEKIAVKGIVKDFTKTIITKNTRPTPTKGTRKVAARKP